jgi:hypothetical protein
MNGALFGININQTITCLKHSILQDAGNGLKPFSVTQFTVHRCDPQKHWKLLHIIPQNFGPIYAGKRILGIPCTQLEKYRRCGGKAKEHSSY